MLRVQSKVENKLFKSKIQNETLFNKGSSNEMYLLQHQTIVQLVIFLFFFFFDIVFLCSTDSYKSQNVLHPVSDWIFLNCENAYLHKMIDKLKMQLLDM